MRTYTKNILVGICIAFVCVACLSGCGSKNYKKAVTAFKNGDYEFAHKSAQRAIQDDPDNKKHLAILAWTYMKQNDLGKAHEVLKQLEEKDDEYIEYVQAKAWFELLSGRPEQAREFFEKELKWAQKHLKSAWRAYYKSSDREYIREARSDAHYGLGLALLQLEDYDNACLELEEAVKRKKGPEAKSVKKIYANAGILKQARKCIAKHQYGRLAALTSQKLAESGENVLYRYYYVLALLGQGYKGEARNELAVLNKKSPYYVDAGAIGQLRDLSTDSLKKLSTIHFEQGNYYLANQTFALLESGQLTCELHLQQAWTTLYLGNYEKSISQFKTLQQKKCGGAQTYVGIGVASFYKGELEQAETCFSNALKQDPNNARARIAMGAIAFTRGEYEQAIRVYENNLDSLPPFERSWSWGSHALNSLGWCYVEQERYKDAEQVFTKLESYLKGRPYPQITNGLAWAKLHQEQDEEAQALFEKTLELSPDYASAKEGLKTLKQNKLAALQK